MAAAALLKSRAPPPELRDPLAVAVAVAEAESVLD